MKFVIVSPRQVSGGPIVLHALCKYLSELGHESRIFYIAPSDYRHKIRFWIKWFEFTFFHDLKRLLFIKMFGEDCARGKERYNGYVDESVKGCKRKWLPWVDKDTIVVYPEIVYGNLLRAEKVVRWLLYFNRFPEDDRWCSKNDLVISYRDIFNDSALNPEGRVVCVSHFDLDLYRRVNYGVRHGKCYILRKGLTRNDLPKQFDGIIIDDLLEIEKVAVFNQAEICISYDTQTAYVSIAALCGCLSVIVPECGKTRKDYLGENETLPGVAFGFSNEEIQYALSSRSEVLKRYKAANESGYESSKRFVEYCKQFFFGERE